MAITCPRCGANFDVTLFQFEHRVRCQCGAWVDLEHGHLLAYPNDETDIQVDKDPRENDAAGKTDEE